MSKQTPAIKQLMVACTGLQVAADDVHVFAKHPTARRGEWASLLLENACLQKIENCRFSNIE